MSVWNGEKGQADAARSESSQLPRLRGPEAAAQGAFLLLISDDGCKACDRMKRALSELTRTEPKLCPAFLLDPAIPLAESLEKYEVADLPTLILFQGAVEQTRWSGFFDTPDDEAREQMRRVLINALARGEGA